jgi:hypothetical protein
MLSILISRYEIVKGLENVHKIPALISYVFHLCRVRSFEEITRLHYLPKSALSPFYAIPISTLAPSSSVLRYCHFPYFIFPLSSSFASSCDYFIRIG